METFSCLKQKEVVNVCDGNRLGFICDLEIDLNSGRIIKIIIPEKSRCFGVFGREKEFRIPYSCIRRIGKDIILVEIDINEVLFNCV